MATYRLSLARGAGPARDHFGSSTGLASRISTKKQPPMMVISAEDEGLDAADAEAGEPQHEQGVGGGEHTPISSGRPKAG